MVILGVDPGLAAAGWGVARIENGEGEMLAAGVALTDSESPPLARLGRIAAMIGQVVDSHAPQIAAVERVFSGRNARTSMALGEARGAVVSMLLGRGVETLELSALQIKKAVAGYGRADKAQVAAMVRRFLRLDERARYPADVTDALACALAAERALAAGGASFAAGRRGRGRWRSLPPGARVCGAGDAR